MVNHIPTIFLLNTMRFESGSLAVQACCQNPEREQKQNYLQTRNESTQKAHREFQQGRKILNQVLKGIMIIQTVLSLQHFQIKLLSLI